MQTTTRPTQYKITEGQLAARLGFKPCEVRLAADVLNIERDELTFEVGHSGEGDKRRPLRRYPISAAKPIADYLRALA